MPFYHKSNNMKIDIKVEYPSILKEYILEYGLSRRFCRKVKLYGKMYINGIESPNYTKVNKDDIITLILEEDINDNIISKSIELEILYEDEHIIVINKPHDLASQPSKLHYENNVISYVKDYFKKNHINSNVHLVNRLDYQTSGLMIIAKDGYTHFLYSKVNIQRKYKCLIEGIITPKEGIINLPIARKLSDSILREVNQEGKQAITKYKVIDVINKKFENVNIDQCSLVDVELFTGRTHQIRVHFSYLGHPIVGDKLYGHIDKRLMLHCYYLSFINPYTNNKIEICKNIDFY